MRLLTPRYPTKSGFKLEQECMTELFCTARACCANMRLDDELLAEISESGFLVGELAKQDLSNYEVVAMNSFEVNLPAEELLKSQTIAHRQAEFDRGVRQEWLQ